MLPYDLCFWASADAAWLVPYLRISRLLVAWPRLATFLNALERWAFFDFTLARTLRIAVTVAPLHHLP